MATVTKIPATVSRYTATPIQTRVRRKVAAYARVSTDHEDQLNSYEAQCDYYTTYIQANDEWEFAGVYSDEGISGTSTRRRDGFNRMVEDALAGRIGLILTKSVSRFARNTVDSLTTIRKLKEHGTEVYFEKENIWTFDSKGELLLTIMSSLAQEESRSISLNVTWGQRKRFADGKATAPFSVFLGYDRGENGEFVINPEQAEIVKIIYGEFLKGFSFKAIARKLTEMGIKSPKGKDVWNESTVKSILTNEKYKGCALLQKHYTADYLTKKIVRNDGVVPQYYVEDCHEAIIDPATFDRVQEMIEQHSKVRHFSGATIFSTKIRCGECGGWFGSKVWHSTDQYRRVIWRCNAKYGGKAAGCNTPHVTEEEVKAAFVRVVNKLIGDRATLLADLREIQETYSGTDELSQRLHELDDRLNAEAEAVQGLIAQNARVAQNQDDYNAAYDAAVSRYETTKAEREKVAADIRQRGIRRREFERFISELEKLPEAVSEFDETLWGSLVDYVTVGKDKTMVFTLIGGTEVKA